MRPKAARRASGHRFAARTATHLYRPLQMQAARPANAGICCRVPVRLNAWQQVVHMKPAIKLMPGAHPHFHRPPRPPTVPQRDDVQERQRAILKALRAVGQQGVVQGAHGVVGRPAAPVHLLGCSRPGRMSSQPAGCLAGSIRAAGRGPPFACAWRCLSSSQGRPPPWGTQIACSCGSGRRDTGLVG